MIDLSYIIGCAIAVLLAIICVKVWPVIKAAIPPTALAVVGWLAESVVRAVEAEFGGGNGEAKREEAFKRINEMLAPFIEFCEKMGFTIDTKIRFSPESSKPTRRKASDMCRAWVESLCTAFFTFTKKNSTI